MQLKIALCIVRTLIPQRVRMPSRISLPSSGTHSSVGYKEKRNNSKVYELTRFCNKINTNVVGGASKLLNYFIKTYSPQSIETYSDNLISDGHIYQNLGFEYVHDSDPGYWYLVDGVRSHRYNWRKQKLKKLRN